MATLISLCSVISCLGCLLVLFCGIFFLIWVITTVLGKRKKYAAEPDPEVFSGDDRVEMERAEDAEFVPLGAPESNATEPLQPRSAPPPPGP